MVDSRKSESQDDALEKFLDECGVVEMPPDRTMSSMTWGTSRLQLDLGEDEEEGGQVHGEESTLPQGKMVRPTRELYLYIVDSIPGLKNSHHDNQQSEMHNRKIVGSEQEMMFLSEGMKNFKVDGFNMHIPYRYLCFLFTDETEQTKYGAALFGVDKPKEEIWKHFKIIEAHED